MKHPALVGLAWAAYKRDRGLLFVGIASAVALLYFTQRTGPWIQLKAICVVGPVALALAFAGVAAIRGVGRFGQFPKAASWIAAGVLTAVVLAGNAMAFHDISLAPTDRMRDLERVGDKFAGQGPTLYPAHEEYAEYFLRKADGSAYVNPASEGSGFVGFRPTCSRRRRSPRRLRPRHHGRPGHRGSRSSPSAADPSGAARRSTTSSSTAHRSPRSGSGRSG